MIRKHIPNTITSLNLLSGVLGITAAFYYRLDLAFYLMLTAAILDFFDGFTARLIGAYSEIGKELDSLADLISFGLLPAIMLHRLMIELGVADGFITFLPLVLVIFSAIRLAKFNVSTEQAYSFIGLATPASALLCGALVYFVIQEPNTFLTTWAKSYMFFPTLALTISFLLVGQTPMFSLKIKKGSNIKDMLPIIILGIAIIIFSVLSLILGINWSSIIILSIVFYILLNYIILFFPKILKQSNF